ncbi:hypothetical protein J1N51_01290 [Psychrosphaera ytuae]|uniref:Uncharacterized protein n=1 Tax=Psychrosphaera ytuae TaxID=2820710 RepID=A0A975DD41_9GAMM|nr:hypothetical protein [Psychrosphaera ytuae]QTH64151.1 hypothetical protein J1N51_01290 [Psychrosphaera ytuae]
MEDLPIIVDVKGLFDLKDHKTAAMLERVNAWINFQALGANWFADESAIPSFYIELYPENQYLQQSKQLSAGWNTATGGGFTGIVSCDLDTLQFKCIAAIANQDLKEMMDDGSIVESNLQAMSKHICNYLSKDLQLNSL